MRVLTVRAVTAEGPATRQRVREVARRLVDTVRPITNALPGGALGAVDLAVRRSTVAESERDPMFSQSVCHVLR